MSDRVDHPTHYNTGRIEIIDFLEDQKLPPNLWNAVKYIARAGKHPDEPALRTLQKAEWYVHREIQTALWPELTSKQAQAKERELATESAPVQGMINALKSVQFHYRGAHECANPTPFTCVLCQVDEIIKKYGSE